MCESRNAVCVSMYPNVGSVGGARTQLYTQALVNKPDMFLVKTPRPASRRSTCRTGSCLTQRRVMHRSLSDHAPFNTSVVQRLPSERGKVQLDALVRRNVPVPHLFDAWTDKNMFTKRPARYWEDQVKKVVPRRPKFAVTSDPGAARLDGWEINDDFVNDTNGLFYSSSKLPKERSFVVDPEWVSEKVYLKSGPKAYRTCAIRYGWCS